MLDASRVRPLGDNGVPLLCAQALECNVSDDSLPLTLMDLSRTGTGLTFGRPVSSKS